MPFTPFHFGPGFLIGELFEKKINLIAILLGSVLVDLRPAYCMFFGCAGSFHGFFHGFLGAIVIALLVSVCVYFTRSWLKPITDAVKIKQSYSLMSIALGSLIGAWLHVTLDSFLYTDMVPFWPIGANPLLGLVSGSFVYSFCAFSFVVGFVIYGVRLYRKQK